MMTDPIADTLTRLRNAMQARHDDVTMPYSRVRHNILKCLFDNGYLKSVESSFVGKKKVLSAALKYTADKMPVVTGLVRVSRPGLRVYNGYREVQSVFSGLGISLLSTPQGILTDREAKLKKVGGEVLCKVW